MASSSDGELQADAFKRLYPEQYYAKFLGDGIRPDGRLLGRGRAVSIRTGAVGGADGSALVKVGSTTVLAAVHLEVSRPEDERPNHGRLQLNVEVAAFSSAEGRSSGNNELLNALNSRLLDVLRSERILDLSQFCIKPSKACWTVNVDIYVLDADGAVFDVSLLAAVASLANAKIPAVTTNKEGQVEKASASIEDLVSTRFTQIPISVTCVSFDSHMIVDPTAEEEAVASSLLTVVLDANQNVYGLTKAGGTPMVTPSLISRIVETGKHRYKEVMEILQTYVLDYSA